MANLLVFDEKDDLAGVIDQFRQLCANAQITSDVCLDGENLITSFHAALCRSASLGNQAHLEKEVADGSARVRIVASSSKTRIRKLRFLSRIFRWRS